MNMPSKTEKQRKTMERAARDPFFAKRKGIKQSVAREFVREDRKKK